VRLDPAVDPPLVREPAGPPGVEREYVHPTRVASGGAPPSVPVAPPLAGPQEPSELRILLIMDISLSLTPP
jgi:hypothetical protein